MYLTILVSFDCVDTKIADRREVQCQCKKMYIQVQQSTTYIKFGVRIITNMYVCGELSMDIVYSIVYRYSIYRHRYIDIRM